MEPIQIFYQAIGFIGTAFMIASYQQRERKNILRCQMCAGAVFAIHYFLLGAYSGAMFNLLAIARSFVFSNRDKKWANSIWWPVSMQIVFFAAGVATWEGLISLLPISAMALTTVSLWLTDTRKVRLLSFPASPMWLVYNAYNHSLACTVTEVFIMISMIVAIIRYDVMKIPEKKPVSKEAEPEAQKAEV